jgi:hypothetical protein
MVSDGEGAAAAHASRTTNVLDSLFLKTRKSSMKNETMIYAKLEFTLCENAQDNTRFRRAAINLLKDFECYLVGVQVQGLTSGEFHCEEAGVEEAESVLNSVFPGPQ